MLTLLIFLPIISALACIPLQNRKLMKLVALAVSGVCTIFSAGLWFAYDLQAGGMQFINEAAWIPQLGISYSVGLDGLSVPFVFLSAFLTFLAVLTEWKRNDDTFYALFLVLQGALTAVFVSLDLILFFIAFEVALIPMFFIIGKWGYDNRRYAAIKFLIYSLVGSVFLLVGILATAYLASPTNVSFDYRVLSETAQTIAGPTALLLCLGFAIAFLIKLPSAPFHTWLPHAHTQAPTAGSIMLAGVMLKMGGYGLIRFNLAFFPEAMHSLQFVFAALAVLSLLYGGFVALGQTDLKQLVAYSSVNHMGFVLLGIASMTAFGVNGAVYQMIAHGVITGLLFMMIGMLSNRTHTRSIAAMTGIYTAMPIFGGVMWLAMLAGAGIPGMAGFVGEFQALLGAFQSDGTALFAVLACFGIVINAALMLWTIQRVLQGEPTEQMKENYDLYEMKPIELMAATPLVILAVLWGLFPMMLTPYIDVGVQQALSNFQNIFRFAGL